MENKWTKDAVIFDLDKKRYPILTYQEMLCEAASCGIEYAVYIPTDVFMMQRLQRICDALDMKLIKSSRVVLPNIFDNPKVGKINEFGEVVSGLVGLPSLQDYQQQKSKKLVFSKGGKNSV